MRNFQYGNKLLRVSKYHNILLGTLASLVAAAAGEDDSWLVKARVLLDEVEEDVVVIVVVDDGVVAVVESTRPAGDDYSIQGKTFVQNGRTLKALLAQ